jgi:phosphinothricin acetyltransferase
MIRIVDDSDAPAITDLYRPIVESTAISFETEPPTEEEIRRRIRDLSARYPWLVYEVSGDLVGFAYASKHKVRAAYQWSVDVSTYVHPELRRRGIARSLYVSLFAILIEQGYFNAFAGIALPNPASVALHESMGFKPLGVFQNVGYKLGAWHSVGCWQLALRPPEPSPPTPLDLLTLQERSDWGMLLAKGLEHGG